MAVTFSARFYASRPHSFSRPRVDFGCGSADWIFDLSVKLIEGLIRSFSVQFSTTLLCLGVMLCVSVSLVIFTVVLK